MGFTILEPGEFLAGFVGEAVAFDAFCKGLERKHAEALAGMRAKHASALSVLEQDKGHIGAAAAEKERVLKKCKENLDAMLKRDEARLGGIYAKMTNAKISGNAAGIESLRAELFANKEIVKQERDAIWKEYLTSCAQIAQKFVAEQNKKNKNICDLRAAQSKELREYEAASLNEKEKRINGKIEEFKSKFGPAAVEREYVEVYAAEPLVENYECRTEIPANVRLGAFSYDLSSRGFCDHAESMLGKFYPVLYRQGKLNIPYFTKFDEGFNYQFWVGEGNSAGKTMIVDRVRSLAMRLFMMIPPGKVNFTFIDPIDLGDSFAIFGRIVDKDDRTNKVINGKIWTTAEDISERLRVLTDHIAKVNQECLQGIYKSIQEYNGKAGQNAEPYQILMIMDFPGGFSETSLGLLEKIISTGPKCGIYTIILKSGEQAKKIDRGELQSQITNIEAKTKRFFVENEELKLAVDGLDEKKIPIKIEPMLPEKSLDEHIIPKLKAGIKNEKRKVIHFDKHDGLLPAKGNWFKGNSSHELVIPIGISGVDKIQNLVLGASAHHALIIGQIGSGKSSLLHTIIMSALVRYPADELRIFLVDFKRGVEFKIYANHKLNVFSAVALESEREFGGSVLAYLDKEQLRRKDMFTREDVDDIQGYRAKKDNRSGKNFLLPRVLLIIDEFQELFKDNDTMGKNVVSLFERIITQGRSFGIHVVLASQRMANIGSVHQSLWGQVGIRIALKCPPADAKLILSEDNDGVDLLAADEPGVAIYNSDCGNKVANTPFRVAYIERDIQNELLKEISNNPPPSPTTFSTRVMVSNIEDNLYHPYQKFIDGDKPDEFNDRVVLIGEPLQLSGKLRSSFKPKESSNMLIIGNDARRARAALAFSALSLSIHAIAKNGWKKPRGQCVYIMDFAPPEEEDEKEHDVLVMLKKQIRDHVKYEEFNDSIDLLKELHQNLPSGGNAAEGRYMLLFGLQRARGLRQGGDPNSVKKNAASAMGDGLGLDIAPKSSVTPYQMLLSVLKDGPENNTHAIVWADNFKTFQAHYPGLLQLFDLRVGFTMANEDSVLFMEEPEGSQIGENNAVLSYNGNQKFRTYQTPDAGWLAKICERINSF